MVATFYDVLGLDEECTTDDIRKAYRRKALETHPDKLEPTANDGEKQVAEEQFHKVREAFEMLSDPHKRRRYDALLAFRSDPNRVSEESARRSADRHEWARQQRELVQRRIDAFKTTPRRATEPTPVSLPPAAPRTPVKQPLMPPVDKVAIILKDLMNANPDFVARREAILKRKAEREQLEKEKEQVLQVQLPPPEAPTATLPLLL